MTLALALSEHGRVGFVGHDGHYVVCFWVAAVAWHTLSRLKLASHRITFGCSFAFFFTHYFLV